MDFTVVVRVRHHFGDFVEDPVAQVGTIEVNVEAGTELEAGAPFVGPSATFQFDCPSVDSSADGVLLFQSMGVSHRNNLLEVNEVTVPGGLYMSAQFLTVPGASESGFGLLEQGAWSANVLLIPINLLRETANTLRIESRNQDGGTDGNLDDFIVDNVVVFYKTRTGRIPPGGTQACRAS